MESGFISPALVYLGNDLVNHRELGQTETGGRKRGGRLSEWGGVMGHQPTEL